MSPSRTPDEVERSIARNRIELQRAVADLRQAATQMSDVKGMIQARKGQAIAEVKGLVTSGREQVTEVANEVLVQRRTQLMAAAAAVGFAIGGGIGGALRLPPKLLKLAFRGLVKLVAATPGAVLAFVSGRPLTKKGRRRAAAAAGPSLKPTRRFRRRVGPALASLAATNQHLLRMATRGGTSRRLARRGAVVGALGGAGILASDDNRRQALRKRVEPLVRRLFGR